MCFELSDCPMKLSYLHVFLGVLTFKRLLAIVFSNLQLKTVLAFLVLSAFLPGKPPTALQPIRYVQRPIASAIFSLWPRTRVKASSRVEVRNICFFDQFIATICRRGHHKFSGEMWGLFHPSNICQKENVVLNFKLPRLKWFDHLLGCDFNDF